MTTLKELATPFQALDFQYQPIDIPFEPVELEFDNSVVEFETLDVKVDWLEAKTLYMSDRNVTYKDLAEKYGVSLKTVKKHGSRDDWVGGRQKVSSLAFTKLQDNFAESAADTNQRHAEAYQQIQELITLRLEMLNAQVTQAINTAEREERIVTSKELPSTALLLSLTRSLVTAVNGERVCLGLPTAIAPAPVGYKPQVVEDPDLEGIPFLEKMERILGLTATHSINRHNRPYMSLANWLGSFCVVL